MLEPSPERGSGIDSSGGSNNPRSDFSPTRRTAVVLAGEGTSAAYLSGALKALNEAGIRIDLVVGKGVGAVVAVFGAIQAADKLYGPSGLLASFAKKPPWRLRAPYRAALICLGIAFGVFLSPALVGLALLVALPLLAVARMIAPAAVASLYSGIEGELAAFVGRVDPFYLRAMALPLAVLFALLMVRWFLPGLLRRGASSKGLGRFLGEGFIELSPLKVALESYLWEAVRGASTETRPPDRKSTGLRYRDLLSASLGQVGFRELIFYALDLDTGQEVPFMLLKERWRSRMLSRGPARGALFAEPMDLSDEAAPVLFDALTASVTPPALLPGVALRLPLEGRHGGEVHRFSSSLLAGQSAVADAVAAGAEQIIYISGAGASGYPEAGSLEKLASAAVRQMLETDLRWAMRDPGGPTVFIVRPEKTRLGAFEFSGRVLSGGERLGLSALVAEGERDTTRLFIQPVVGGTGRPKREDEAHQKANSGLSSENGTWSDGPREL